LIDGIKARIIGWMDGERAEKEGTNNETSKRANRIKQRIEYGKTTYR
jgi:hypothetical protein